MIFSTDNIRRGNLIYYNILFERFHHGELENHFSFRMCLRFCQGIKTHRTVLRGLYDKFNNKSHINSSKYTN